MPTKNSLLVVVKSLDNTVKKYSSSHRTYTCMSPEYLFTAAPRQPRQSSRFLVKDCHHTSKAINVCIQFLWLILSAGRERHRIANSTWRGWVVRYTFMRFLNSVAKASLIFYPETALGFPWLWLVCILYELRLGHSESHLFMRKHWQQVSGLKKGKGCRVQVIYQQLSILWREIYHRVLLLSYHNIFYIR
jgi:hypothetical protein